MKELLSKIHKINEQVQCVEKGGKNTFAKYSYSRLGDILAPIRPLLTRFGLVVTQSTSPIHNTVEVIDGKYYTSSACTCTTTVYDIESGQNISVESVGFSMDKAGDKAAYKAITGARKYGITEMFNLDWDAVEPEDDRYDANRPTSSNTKKTPVSKRVYSQDTRTAPSTLF